MDQEIYDVVLTALEGMEDQNGVRDFALLLAFHFPDQGRTLLGLPPRVEVPEHDTMTDEEEATNG